MDKGIPIEMIVLLLKKGIFPYEYIDSHEKFKETSIPPIEKFLGVLKGKITQKDYKHAEKVLNEFKCKNLGEYHDLYLKPMCSCLELDPSHYVSAASLYWDAMLKYTEVKIELLQIWRCMTLQKKRDVVELQWHVGVTLGPITQNAKTFTCAVQKHGCHTLMQIILYGWAMSQYLPIGGNNKKVLDTILKKRNDASRGYYVQLECHFPSQTHNYLQDLPPTVENIKVVDEVRKVLSFDSLELFDKLKTNHGKRRVSMLIKRYNKDAIGEEKYCRLLSLNHKSSKYPLVLGQSWLTVHEAIINLCRSEISLYGMSIPFIDEEELYSDKDLYYEFRELLTKKYFRGGNDHKLHDSFIRIFRIFCFFRFFCYL
ncbi:hypothetical protein RhiirC2_709745 [Rhizophagus irregularis]|uniref:Uncharacterized protein n=1 Tax=Rhizophagus irregularis TaxID=588596 RepID=A0A2N1NHG4_9GLOM|nr:hypothetical protein RhiirC2_709745 [Rhizophagus irregularis]